MSRRDEPARSAGAAADEDGFLTRWSRRKAAAARGEALDPAPEGGAVVEAATDASSQAPAEERSEDEILAEHGLPRPEDLQPGDGVSGFFREGVPEALRRRALRRLWRLNPALANLDALVDYGEDYTDAALAVQQLQTVYEAGDGYAKLFKSFREEASDAAAHSAPANEEDADADAKSAEAPTEAPPLKTLEEAPKAALEPAPPAGSSVAPPPPRPRRMRFETDPSK